MTLFLDAVMEALNVVLHHEPVFGVPTEPNEEEVEGPLFVTRSLNGRSTSSSRGTTTIETPLEIHSQARWRYITRIARGEIVSYRDIADTLRGQSGVAQLQFSVTEYGTVVFIAYGFEATGGQYGKMPNLRGEDNLQVFTCLNVKLSTLRKMLMGKDGWFRCYQLRQQTGGYQAWKDAMDQTLQWLYTQIMVPIDAHLKSRGVKHLRMIPHRALQLIPFSALYYTDRHGQRHYLIDDYDIEYAPSATLQHICRERASTRTFQQSLTAVANTTNDLPFSAAEIEQVAVYFPASSVQVWYGDSARLEAVMASKLGSVFHFSGHASYDWDDPLASHLLFTRNERLSLNGLFAEAIQLPETSFVVLSACETNVTNPGDLADEYLGLASGFLFAGTPSVISTLWAVDDISTALLVTHFYQKYFIDGLPPSQALQSAQRWLCETVDRCCVIKYIQSQLEALQNQALHAPRWSETAEALVSQIRRLKNRLGEEKKRNPNDKPFDHPYY